MKIVVLDGFNINPGDLSWDDLEALGDDVRIYHRTAPDQVIKRSKDAEVILTNKVVINDETMEELPRLKYIGVLATGTNVVDIEAAHKRGIIVTNIPSYSTMSVAQIVFALLLAITQHPEYYTEQNRRGKWAKCADFSYADFPQIELAGKTLGIVGFGHIGQAVARIAEAFGMNVAVATSKPQEALPGWCRKLDIDRLFAESDVVSLHCPLAPDTKNLVDDRKLALMKPEAILINTARGPLVDEAALAEALNSGKIYAAGLDVLSQEPPKADNPLLSARNCYITPHIAWATLEARRRLMKTAVENLKAFQAGTPCNVV